MEGWSGVKAADRAGEVLQVDTEVAPHCIARHRPLGHALQLRPRVSLPYDLVCRAQRDAERTGCVAEVSSESLSLSAVGSGSYPKEQAGTKCLPCGVSVQKSQGRLDSIRM